MESNLKKKFTQRSKAGSAALLNRCGWSEKLGSRLDVVQECDARDANSGLESWEPNKKRQS